MIASLSKGKVRLRREARFDQIERLEEDIAKDGSEIAARPGHHAYTVRESETQTGKGGMEVAGGRDIIGRCRVPGVPLDPHVFKGEGVSETLEWVVGGGLGAEKGVPSLAVLLSSNPRDLLNKYVEGVLRNVAQAYWRFSDTGKRTECHSSDVSKFRR